jgi:tether containing UBX domain for GLUT4
MTSLDGAEPAVQPSPNIPLPTDFNVYKPSNVSVVPQSRPVEYYTPTAAVLNGAQATLSARTQALVNAPLQLRATREAAEKAKRDRWPQTTIRVRFMDRTQLEKIFPSTDKIRSVYAFVRNCLREDVKPIKFILYQSPPKRDLKVSDPKVRDSSLAQLQLAPSSILLLRFEDEALNRTDVPAPLASAILSQAMDLPISTSQAELPTSSSSKGVPSAQPKTSQLTEKKIPKWLKLGQKK